MARPKLKDGYTRIVHKLFEQLYLRDFKLTHLRVILLMMRMAYGTQKDYVVIKPKCRLGLAGLHKQDVKKIVEELVEAEIIKIIDIDTYGINKDFSSWKVPYSKFYDESQHTELVKINLNSKEKTYSEVSKNLTKNEKKVSNLLTTNPNEVSKKLTTSNEKTYPEVSKNLTKNEKKLVNSLLLDSGNADEEHDTNPPKDNIKDKLKINNKDNTYIIQKQSVENGTQKIKKTDPYFNPVAEYFVQKYKEIVAPNIFLLKNQREKLAELNDEIENFKETIPECLEKLKNVDFKNLNNDFNANYIWLLTGDNYIKVLTGVFEHKKSEKELFYEEMQKKELKELEELGIYNDD